MALIKLDNNNNRQNLKIVCEDFPPLFNQYGIIAINPNKHQSTNYEWANTYISWMLIRGETHEVIRRNCGTGIGNIEKFYSKHIQIDKFKKQLTELSNYKSLYQ